MTSTLPRAWSTCAGSSPAPTAASGPGAWPPKTAASVRDIPLVTQLTGLLAAHKLATPFSAGTDWVFATSHGTPHGHRNVARRCLTRAAERAGLNDDGWPPLRFHDLRHAFASHLIVD